MLKLYKNSEELGETAGKATDQQDPNYRAYKNTLHNVLHDSMMYY